METGSINLESYFRRISYSGGNTPNLQTLQALMHHHTQSIPFENLSSFLGYPVAIDPLGVEQKLVRSGRGGYCYEQNGLFRQALETLGFTVTGLGARVLWQQPQDARPAQTHMILHTRIDGVPYLVDVGFGSQTPTAPLRLDTELEQPTPHGTYRVFEQNNEYCVARQLGNTWAPMYRFDMQEQYPADYKVANWYVSTHPDSQFVTHLIAARPVADGRYTLLDRELTLQRQDGSRQKSILTDASQVRSALTEIFGINITALSDLDRALAGTNGGD